ncbi:MAG: flagellar hook protein FlgE [Planctomycetaceae bacterium]
MANSLLTGVSGLNSHQQMLNVIGNNIANMNTTGYKARTALFSDLLYDTLSAGSGGTAGVLGGTNPTQVGTGSRLSQIDVNLAQGNFNSTGNDLDLGIDGDGYFVVQSGNSQLYTRAGVFRLDSNGFVVDPSTGFRVQRFGTLGEPNGSNPAFQTPGNSDILIPLGAVIPGQETSKASIGGNLPFRATGPLAQIVESTDPLTESGAAATAATLLNNLDANLTGYGAGDAIVISGTDADGTAVSVNLAVTATTTLGDLLNAISGAFSGATASIDAQGKINLTSANTGPSFLSLSLRDAVGNVGASEFTTNPFITSRNGKDADTVEGAFQFFDGRGDAHLVNLTFEKQADDTWTLTADFPSSEGTIIDGLVTGLVFNDDGSFSRVTGSGLGNPAFEFQFAGQDEPQTITIDFGASTGSDGITSLSTGASISLTQDGFGVGSLTSIRVNGDGQVDGIASNGRTIPLAQLAIAKFSNPNGLEGIGQNYFMSSTSSGNPQLGTARSGSRGTIRAGELEQSNVDLALEFTRLIVAQRGFSANARTITVSSEILEELTNLIR